MRHHLRKAKHRAVIEAELFDPVVVMTRRPDQDLVAAIADAQQQVVPHIAGRDIGKRDPRPELDRIRIEIPIIEDRVAAIAQIEHIGVALVAADKIIIARTADQTVVAIARAECFRPLIALYYIITRRRRHRW